ncbi:MAG: creatininase family protein, partial [Bacteroidota bacterium]
MDELRPNVCVDVAAVAAGLESLAANKIKQIGSDAAHLYHLLAQKGVAVKGKPHPEIVHLRFNKERSHIQLIPINLRKPLYKIMLEHAEGAVERINHKWVGIDLLNHPDLLAPYPFEHLVRAKAPAKELPKKTPINKFLWGELTWEEAEEHLQKVDIALLPVGAIEQHGPHLPLDVDAFDADYLAKKVAAACSHPKPLVLPLVLYGVSYHHEDFRGTISISNEAMAQYIYEIGKSVAKNGIKKLIIVNGHGDNAPTLNYAAQMINRDTGIFVCIDTGETSDTDLDKLITTKNDAHAGETETSTTLDNRPQLVQMDKAVDMTLQFNNRYLDFSSKHSLPWYVRTKKISENGTMGNPCLATA